MDVLSHWLWGAASTRGKISWKIAGPMSVIPDLLAFIPSTISTYLAGKDRVKIDSDSLTSDLPPIAWQNYQITHSLVIVTILSLLTYLYLVKKGPPHILVRYIDEDISMKKLSFYLWLPWFLHILVDIPTHTLQFFPTPLFYPLSDWMFDGVRWSTPWVWILNVIGLACVWAYLLFVREKKTLPIKRLLKSLP